MSVIDNITDALNKLPRGADNALTLQATDFNLDEVTQFFQQALAGQALVIDEAVITPEQQTISVGGQAELLGYTDLTTLLTFQSVDSTDDLTIEITGDFDPASTLTLPLVPWLSIYKLGLKMTQTTEFGILAFTVYGSLQVGDADQGDEVDIPIVLTKTGNADWNIEIAEDQSIALPDLNHLAELLGGEAAASFFPQPLVDAIADIAVGGIDCQFNTQTSSVSYFTVTISTQNSWQIASQIEILAGMSLALILLNPVGGGTTSVIGTVRGTAQFNGLTIPMYVQASAGGSTTWEVGILPDDGVTMPGISTLLDLAGGEDFYQTLPDGFRDIPDILINHVLIQFDPVQKTLDQIAFAISTAQSWEIIAGYLAITNLSLEMTVNNLTTPSQCSILGSLIGIFEVGETALQFSLTRTLPTDNWTVTGALGPNESVNLTAIAESLFADIVTLPSNLPAIVFTQVSASVTPATQTLAFSAQSTSPWLFGTFQINTFGLDFRYNPGNTPALAGTIATVLSIAGVDLSLSAALNDAATQGWQFIGSTGKDQIIPIGDLLAYIMETFGIEDLPDWFTGITLQNLEVDFNTNTETCHFAITGTFPIATSNLVITLKIGAEYQTDTKSYTKTLDGTITFGTAVFTFDFTSSSASTAFKAVWQETNGQALGFNDLATELGLPSPDIPSDLDLALRSATLTYDSSSKEFILSADSANYGQAVFVTLKNQGQQCYAFALGVGTPINLSNLPLIGTILSHIETISIENIQVLIAAAPISADTAKLINPLIPSGFPLLPTNGTTAPVCLSCILNFGGDTIPLNLGIAEAQSNANTTTVGSAQGKQATSVATTPPTATDGTTWFTIQKTFGPVTFSKIGVRYQQSVLWFLLNASLAAGGVTISLNGLAVGSPIKDFQPQFNLDGLGLDVQEPPVEIGGGFLHVPPVSPIALEFDGAAIIKAPDLSIAAYGSYAQLEDGQPSMFIFAQLQAPLGGPPMFFVTGLAGGFGYNSSLRIPGQDEISTFPFVAGLTDPNAVGGSGASPIQALGKLTGGNHPWVSLDPGEVWIAAGIMFTSFELLRSNALLVAEFGNDLTIALIGLSTARFPQTGTNIYAQVELQLEALFQPSAGIFSVTAVLSRNSFLLDPSCLLTGGFAFFIWFENSGHDGDFVLTLGGYNPTFDRASWYPVEPAVGFSWPVNANVSITGSAYFALTPSAIMAGGALAINFHDGNLKAWFIAHADLIIFWKPFHFSASVGVSIGVSYTLDILGIQTTLSIELGADLELWGPPTGGIATIHCWIISFTVPFGADPAKTPQPLSWADFQTLLPAPQDIIRITPVNGLSAQESTSSGEETNDANASKRWIVRGSGFQFTTSSSVPSSQIFLGSQSTTPFQQSSALNIRPMQKTGLTSKHSVSLIPKAGSEPTLDPDWSPVATSGNVPKALWGTASNGQLEQGDAQLVNNQLLGVTLTAPKPAPGSSTGPIDMQKYLSHDQLSPQGISPLAAGLAPTGDIPQVGQNTVKTIEKEMMSDDVQTARNQLFTILQTLLDPDTNEPLTLLASNAGQIYADEPMLVGQAVVDGEEKGKA